MNKTDVVEFYVKKGCFKNNGRTKEVKVKGKGSSLAIAPLTILDSGAFTTSEVAADWHWL